MNYTIALDVFEEIKEFDTLVLKGFPYAGVSVDAVVLKVYKDNLTDNVKSIFVKVLNGGSSRLPIRFVDTHFKGWKKLGVDNFEGLFLRNIDYSDRPNDITLTVSDIRRCGFDTTYTETHTISTIGSDGSQIFKNSVKRYRVVRFMERSSSHYGRIFSSTGTCYITQEGYYGYASEWNFQSAVREARDKARMNESRRRGN